MHRLGGLLLAAFVASGAGIASSAAAREECAPRPSDPVGYQVKAVHADTVQDPAGTPPIAILDTGVSEVPELSGRVRKGYNAVTGSADTSDSDGHGTAVAGVAAAAAGGLRGVSPTSPLIPIAIFDASGNASARAFTDGIDRALALGARVINVSAAAPAAGTGTRLNRAIENVIDRATARGVPVIAPSGNEGAGTLDVPANYPHVIAVGATDESNQPAPFSNTGAGLDIVAPGTGLYTVAPTSVCPSGYAFLTGTSFAAPAVAGAAALLLQRHPNLDTTQLTEMLTLHGAAPAWRPDLGFGMLDVSAVLAAPVPTPDAPEVDDTIAWAKRHPPVLTPAKHRVTVSAHVAPHSDPSDTFRVRLKKGDRLRATARAASGRVRLTLSDGKHPLRLGKRVARGGIYYVAVAPESTPPAGTHYTLTLKR